MVAKTLAEKVAWEWMAQNQPHFALTTILPSTFFWLRLGKSELSQVSLSSLHIWSTYRAVQGSLHDWELSL